MVDKNSQIRKRSPHTATTPYNNEAHQKDSRADSSSLSRSAANSHGVSRESNSNSFKPELTKEI